MKYRRLFSDRVEWRNDVPHYPRRIIRSRSDALLKGLFSSGQKRISVYIPLKEPLQNPRYDFLADEDNWN